MALLALWFTLLVALPAAVTISPAYGTAVLIQRVADPGPTEEDLEAAFQQVRDRLRASPEFHNDSADTHYRLAKLLHHRGDVNGAAEEYRLTVQRDPHFVDAYRDLGALLLDRHDYAGAVAALEQAVQLKEGDGETYYWLGRGFMGTGDWAKAALALHRATRIKPNDAEAYADLGLVRMVEGDVAGATQALRTSIELKPDYAEAHALMETLTAHQADRDQLKRSAQKIVTRIFAR